MYYVFKLIGDFAELVSTFFPSKLGLKGKFKGLSLSSPQQLPGLLGAGGQPQLTLQPFLGGSPGSMGLGERQLVSVFSGYFVEWPQAWHWNIRICITFVNTTHPTPVTPQDPTPSNLGASPGALSATGQPARLSTPEETLSVQLSLMGNWQVATGLRGLWAFC